MKNTLSLFILITFFLSCNQQFYDRERSLEYSADNAYIDAPKHLLCLRGKAYFIDPSIEIKADSIDIHHKSGKVIVYGTDDSPAEIYLKQSNVKVLGKYEMSGVREQFYRSFDYYPQINRIRFHTDNQKWKIF
ncbi:hypothetical protein [Flammeovirga aprica]|uniref:Organic solvent tolerance-like N-terminal domain-containing protein n=1 Tax=Flammeovirga aprica JL-4 TaxID=694437 RepID=A0A7X9RY10_9BACT|nr:hypothetical protein [Flammeovirga aprica]NME70689.1 hypothetical protein [Flammeovirga aprica JL-4]